MGFLKHFRSRSKKKNIEQQRQLEQQQRDAFHHRYGSSVGHNVYYPPPPRKDCTQKLPPQVLFRIFGSVCPHALDDSLNSSEESMTEDGCMLCDMRDLAHCALVSRRWYGAAQQLL